MINERKVKRFCKDYTKIENYEDAINDTTQTWHCHHILGEILSRQQLLDHDFYYDVPPCMLKFVTRTEHNRLHNTGKNHPLFGKHHTDETKKKMSKAHKNMSDETHRKIADAIKGKKRKPASDEHRRKLSEALRRSWALRKKKMNGGTVNGCSI